MLLVVVVLHGLFLPQQMWEHQITVGLCAFCELGTSCFIVVSYRFNPMFLEAGEKVGRSRVFPFSCTNLRQEGLCLRLTKKLTNIDIFACYTCI